MGLFSKLLAKNESQENSSIKFSKEELSLIKSIPIMAGDKYNVAMQKKSIYEQSSSWLLEKTDNKIKYARTMMIM